mgnify:CR=1 FL=1
MVVKGNVSISDHRVILTCPECNHQHEAYLVEIENKKEATCPHCGRRFEIKV